jgi:tetratricopeptide (TPR) repeat protein
MAELLRPDVPPGPIRVLYEEMHGLHHRAGWPSVREMAKHVGCGRTTVSRAFSRPGVPRWGLLELIVETLGGDIDRFHRLWLAASLVEKERPAQRCDADQAGRWTVPAPQVLPAVLPQALPRELPGDVPAFTGRAQQLEQLDRLLAAGGRSPAAVISAVSGTAGVGKTALALHWAHRVADRFPDGQLYVNLRGYDPDGPVRPDRALAAFLRDLGVPAAEVPHQLAERAARYRTLLAGRRLLVVLDNARSVDQVRDLLPGTPSCPVLVTSRDRLAGLVARHGAHRIDLDLLPAADAVALLRALAGERIDAEPAAAAALAARCARLPLALRVAAELAAARPATSLAALVAELGDPQRSLDVLDAGGDEHTAVRAVFSWSYRHLSAGTARAFRLLGLHPGVDIAVPAAASLTGLPPRQAARALADLTRAHLLTEHAPGRFSFHDLLRAYAADRAARDSEDGRRAALTRLFDHYLHTAATAMDALAPAERDRRPRVQAAVPAMPDPRTARTWLDAEAANLLAVAVYADEHNWPGLTHQLAATASRYLGDRSNVNDILALHRRAVHAARRDGDRSAETRSLSNLGGAHARAGEYEEALGHHRRALAMCREDGDRRGEAYGLMHIGMLNHRNGRHESGLDHLHRALMLFHEIGEHLGEAGTLANLGAVYERTGRYHEAIDHLLRAVALVREVGDALLETIALANLGHVCGRLGRHQEALTRLQQAHALSRDTSHPSAEGFTLDLLGVAHARLGRHSTSARCHEEALAIFRRAGNRQGEGYALDRLGTTHARERRYRLAADHHRDAIAVFREIGDIEGQSTALNSLGETLHASGAGGPAGCHHGTALALATAMGGPYEQARAHNGLAHALHATGNPQQARHHRQRARTLYTALGVPWADQIRRYDRPMPAQPETDFPKGIAAPAVRALVAAGYTELNQLAGVPASELRRLHGMGPTALVRLQEALEQQGMSLG